MSEENISQEFRLRNVNKTKYYFLKEIQQNKLMSEKHKKVCTTLNDIENFVWLLHWQDVFQCLLLLLCLAFL